MFRPTFATPILDRVGKALFGFWFAEIVTKTTTLSSSPSVQVFRGGLLGSVGMLFGFLFENGDGLEFRLCKGL